MDFTTEGGTLNNVKSAAGDAAYGLGITLTGNKGLITVPQPPLRCRKNGMPTRLFCKLNNGQPAKMSNVTFDNSAETTKMTVNIVETGGDYYSGRKNHCAGSHTISWKSDGTTPGDSGNTGSGSSGGNSCTISISCSTILNNMGNLKSGKESFVPSDGWILKPTTVQFNEGESVHDVLRRVCRDNGFIWNPALHRLIMRLMWKVINQLYEFDCGELSGWMYNVNGWFPNYGCSQYTVENGDVINWVLYL